MVSHIVPVLNPDLKIYPFDSGSILIECNRHQLKIKKEIQAIIDLVNGSNNIEDITKLYCSATNNHVSENFIYSILYNDLATYGIIISDRVIKIKERSLHLRLSFIFWKGKSLEYISRSLSFLFKPSVFYITLLSMIVFVGGTMMRLGSTGAIRHVDVYDIAGYVIASFFVLMLHEVGHVAACYKFGAKHNGIGFGFYLFTPVFFADVSDAWKLARKERVIINLAGIYFEFATLTVLCILYLAYNNDLLYYAGIAILIHIAFNLNPFLKYDGYWILSDITNIANLRAQSTLRMSDALSINKLKRFSIKDYGLLLYALSSYLVIAAWLYLFFIYDSEAIMAFPGKVVNSFRATAFMCPVSMFVQKVFANLIPLMFYIMVSRLIFRLLKKFLSKYPRKQEF